MFKTPIRAEFLIKNIYCVMLHLIQTVYFFIILFLFDYQLYIYQINGNYSVQKFLKEKEYIFYIHKGRITKNLKGKHKSFSCVISKPTSVPLYLVYSQ